MSKKWILAACLIASGQLNASELDNLVNSSNALRQQFSNGIIAVGGMINVAQDGGIPSNELLANKDAYIPRKCKTHTTKRSLRCRLRLSQTWARRSFLISKRPTKCLY